MKSSTAKSLIIFLIYAIGISLFQYGEESSQSYKSANELFSPEELKQMLLTPEFSLSRAFLPPTPYLVLNELLARASATELPSEFDFRKYGYVSPVKDQQQGACWVFSAIATIESAIMKFNGGVIVDLSEEEISSCYPKGESGGLEYEAFAYILKGGVASESNYPWNMNDHECHPPLIKDFFINDYSVLNFCFLSLPERILLMKQTLLENGPVSVGFMVYKDLFDYNGNGVYIYNGSSLQAGGHAVQLIGWKDDPTVVNGGYWICKNSWSTRWGDEGFFRIGYGQCDIDSDAQFVRYDPQDPAPIFRIKPGYYYLQTGHSIVMDISARSNRGASINYSVSNLPSGAQYNSDSGMFSWIPTKNQAGTYEVAFIANDGTYSTFVEFTFTVTDYYNDLE
jgi:C1A family cysteine protease